MSRLKGLSVVLAVLLVLQLMVPVFGNAQSDDAGRIKIEKTSQTAESVQWRVTVNASGTEHDGIQAKIIFGAGLSPAGIAGVPDDQVSNTGDGYTVQLPAGSGALVMNVTASVTDSNPDFHEIKAVADYPDGTFQAADRAAAIKPEIKEEEKPAEQPAEKQAAKAEEPVKKENAEPAAQPEKETEQPAEEKESPAEEVAPAKQPAQEPSGNETAPEPSADLEEANQSETPVKEAEPKKEDPAPEKAPESKKEPVVIEKEAVLGTVAPVAVEAEVLAPMNVGAQYYDLDPNAVVVPTTLEGVSTNSHTMPLLMWVNANTVYVAVRSTHALDYMELAGVKATNPDKHVAMQSIFIDGEEKKPDVGIQGNTKDARWTVYKFNEDVLNLLDNATHKFFVDGIGNGHDVGGQLVVDIPKINVIGNKVWVGGTERPAIKLQLMAQAEGDELHVMDTGVVNGAEKDAWTFKWNQVPAYSPIGKLYTYTIDEASVPPNYEKTLDGLTVTNTYNPAQLTIKVNKAWIGPEGGPVTIKLIANGADTGKTLTLDPQNNWTGSFSVNKLHDKTGEPITYTVKEVPVPGYTTQLSGSVDKGFTFTNTHSGTIDIKVDKKWIGPAAESVTVNLLADGTPTGKSLVLNEENGWGSTFEGLRKYDAKTGAEIVYTVKEVPVPGYSSDISGTADTGFTIVNTNDAVTSVDVRKEWVGPEAGPVTIELLADGEETGITVILSGENNWSGTFADLRKYDAKTGKAISYTVTEPEVPEQYEVSYSIGANGEFIVTNTARTGSLTVTKVDERGDPLAGAEFELRDTDGNLIGTGTSGADGKIFFGNLDWGSYLLVETKAPEGYRLLTKPIEIKIGADRLDIKETVKNTPTDWGLPATGGFGTIPFYMVGVMMMAAAVFTLRKKKRMYE
ncbi:Cna B-type domain-containing protein [Bhargavaea massiliensis]|uniref:Cna B-type domain-containing protein n=1 Tax=Bhargavaea massiliensis TaxID=2697500 RepID=UPI001BCB71EA|nr:Cna B-type domain-containing protein [Bhargavaea massiliensis]